MSNTQVLEENPLEDGEFVDGEFQSGCENCGKPLSLRYTTYCPYCGYYPSLGTCIEVDEWETPPEEESQEQAAPVAEQPEWQEHISVWLNLLPPWAWILIGVNAAVVAVSVSARFIVDSPSMLTTWSCTQLFGGITAFLCCHVLAYLKSISQDTTIGMLDIVLRPLRVWRETVRRLPDSLPQVSIASGGFMAAIMALLVVGGIPYHALLDWGIEAPPEKNLMGAVMARAQQIEGDGEGDLEDAVENFAGQAGDLEELTEEEREALERPHKFDCVIIGFDTPEGQPHLVESIVLAREFNGKLIVVGRASHGLEEEVRLEYVEKFQQIRRRTPFVKTNIDAKWVKPVYTCRVRGKGETRNGRIEDLRYVKMLKELDF